MKFLFLASLTLLLACINNQSSLPSTWQPGMKFTVYTGPGMLPDSWQTTITADSSKTVFKNSPDKTTTYHNLSKKQLDSLALMLKKNSFDRIESKKRDGIVYDKRTTSYQLEWKGKIYLVTSSASMEIAEKDGKKMREIYQFLDRLLLKAGG